MQRVLRSYFSNGWPNRPPQVWQTSSLNASRAIHLYDRKGSLEVGKDADLVLVDEQINVCLTLVEGQVVYRK